MDDSDAPTDAAVERHMLWSPTGTVTSFLTTDVQEHDGFRTPASLSGRAEQIELIRAAYDRVANSASEAVLVSGLSGTGKSSLIEFMREIITKNDGGYFVSGKFDQLVTRKESFSAIAEAFSDICDLILQDGDLKGRKKEISAALGPDSQILSRIVSNIRNITEQDDEEDSILAAASAASTAAAPPTSINSDEFALFKLACQRFLRAVATAEHPLLIFLDDLQWADEMSVKLIKSLMRDMESHHMLLCVAYRGDEIDGKVLLELSDASESTSELIVEGEELQHIHYTELEVRNLDTAELCGMLAQLLHMSSDSLGPLASLLLEKTAGNPNAVVQLLQHLKAKRLLTFSNDSFSWEWNMHGIESEVSDNPTEIIAQKINLLDKDVQETLKLAAYLGHTFDADVLQKVVSYGQGRIDDSKQTFDVVEHLQMTTDKGLTEAKGGGIYRFTHDSNQHYMYNAIESELEQEFIYLQIGRSLVKLIRDTTNPNQKESFVFLAASNMVRGSKHIDSDEERLATIQFFLDTARLAASAVTVGDASDFLACAIRMLKEGDYISNYELYMELHTTYAEVQSCTGFFDESSKTIDTILRDAKFPKDKFRAQCIKIQSLVYQQRHDEMFDFAFKVVLQGLGVFIPIRPSKIHVLVELLRTKVALRKVEPEDFLSMPAMKDEKMLAAVKVLSIVAPVVFLLPGKELWLVSTLRRVRYDLKYGVSTFTAVSLVGYATLLSMLGKADEAYKLGKVTVELSYREENLSIRAVCLACTGLFINPSRQRLDTLTEPTLESYNYGMKSRSDLDTAFFGLSCYLEVRLHLGTRLSELEEELRRYCHQMKELQANRMLSYQLMMWQYVKNLRGRSDDPAVLTGDVMDEEEHLEVYEASGDTNGRLILNWYRLRLQVSFEEWDSVRITLFLVIKDIAFIRGGLNYFFCVTDVAMASLGLFERTGKKKYRKIALKFMKKLEKATKDGVLITKPFLSLLTAEWKAVVEDEDARDAYDEAIEELVDHKLVAYEMMAYQRAMRLMVRQMNSRRAKDYLTISLERLRRWGNLAVFEYLEGTHAEVMKSVKPAYEVEVTKTLPTEEEPHFPFHIR